MNSDLVISQNNHRNDAPNSLPSYRAATNEPTLRTPRKQCYFCGKPFTKSSNISSQNEYTQKFTTQGQEDDRRRLANQPGFFGKNRVFTSEEDIANPPHETELHTNGPGASAITVEDTVGSPGNDFSNSMIYPCQCPGKVCHRKCMKKHIISTRATECDTCHSHYVASQSRLMFLRLYNTKTVANLSMRFMCTLLIIGFLITLVLFTSSLYNGTNFFASSPDTVNGPSDPGTTVPVGLTVVRSMEIAYNFTPMTGNSTAPIAAKIQYDDSDPSLLLVLIYLVIVLTILGLFLHFVVAVKVAIDKMSFHDIEVYCSVGELVTPKPNSAEVLKKYFEALDAIAGKAGSKSSGSASPQGQNGQQNVERTHAKTGGNPVKNRRKSVVKESNVPSGKSQMDTHSKFTSTSPRLQGAFSSSPPPTMLEILPKREVLPSLLPVEENSIQNILGRPMETSPIFIGKAGHSPPESGWEMHAGRPSGSFGEVRPSANFGKLPKLPPEQIARAAAMVVMAPGAKYQTSTSPMRLRSGKLEEVNLEEADT